MTKKQSVASSRDLGPSIDTDFAQTSHLCIPVTNICEAAAGCLSPCLSCHGARGWGHLFLAQTTTALQSRFGVPHGEQMSQQWAFPELTFLSGTWKKPHFNCWFRFQLKVFYSAFPVVFLLCGKTAGAWIWGFCLARGEALVLQRGDMV